MLKRKQTRAIQKFIYSVFKQFWHLSRSASRKLSRWLARNFLKTSHKGRTANARSGFVLPTVTLLLLVVALVIAAILIRTGSRTNQVIGAREEQVIYNAATPAIERAKAKLEYLFSDKEIDRRPTGIPSDAALLSMLLNDQNQYYPGLIPGKNPDPYTLPDEKEFGRIDINADGKPDPAWAYKIDVDNDGTQEIVVYGIFLKRQDPPAVGNPTVKIETNTPTAERDKAKALVTRNGPISTIDIGNSICSSITQPPAPGGNNPALTTDPGAWFPVGTAVLRKTFQVDAIVISNKAGTSRTVATLEFQQDRELNRGNKWGAWFRNDLEIFPGSNFNWNGAMYTAGNLIVGDGSFKGYLISAPKSCFYTKDASEITIAQADNPGFQGQIIAGKTGDEGTQWSGGSIFHVQKQDNSPNYNEDQTKLTTTTDSVNQSKTPVNISLDPVKLFTEDISAARSVSPFNNREAGLRDTGWDTNNETGGQIGYFKTRGRIFNRSEAAPFVDDTYRADDRYGPKPRYKDIVLDAGAKKNGANITDAADREKLTKNTTDALDTEFRNLGLDGYWERRAWANGTRVVVGERLELGDPFGWTNNDPLYPATGGTNEARQRRTLRDNLAAVQATAVYSIGSTDNNLPIACIATTAHPGTQATISRSKNFSITGDSNDQNNNKYLLPNTSLPLYSDFFTGQGTNGWEYNPPPTNFAADGNWQNALWNLALLAGDYQDANNNGAFPPTQTAGGNRVFPHPYLSMWGNFSNLRRALEAGNGSIADNTYLQTAACTLGMLAYNVNYFQAPNYTDGTLQSALNNLNDRLRTLDLDGSGSFGTGEGLPVGSKPDDYINALSDLEAKRQAEFVALKEQIARDRRFGFALSPTTGNFLYPVNYHDTDSATPLPALKFGGVDYNRNGTSVADGKSVEIGCDFTANNYFGFGAPNSSDSEAKFIRLAVSLCPKQPKYPSLYYLFPTADHNRRDPYSQNPQPQPPNEPYTDPTLNPALPNLSRNFITVNIANIALAPKQPTWSGCNNTGWCLPTGDSGDADFQITLPGGGNKWVSIIDSAFFNSREMMTVRALDLDLRLLKNNNIGSNTWLPTSGIMYAFREDAVREDAISRPRNAGWGSCNTDAAYASETRNASCGMIVNTPQDPPLNDKNFISPKPIDYYPDPDRRPHGFRLRNGEDLRRGDDNPRGLTFVSDNPVYIQGNFNLHSTNGTANEGSRLEEFTTKLDDNYGPDNFYNQRTTLEPKFARIGSGNDTWRPSEILADAVTILSNSFVEGSIDRGIVNDDDSGRTNAPSGRYSYRAMNGPDVSNSTGPAGFDGWVLENGKTISTNLSTLPLIPIKISRNGNPVYCDSPSDLTNGKDCPSAQQKDFGAPGNTGSYRVFGTNYRPRINAADNTRVNAMIISGIVPSQKNQSYGGLHNFPRFIEQWDAKNMFISGSFVQLNFSTYATGPYEQDAWEPGSSPNTDVKYINYYGPPNRRWGYDVGLQYAPAGPIAQRLVGSSSSRSEFYRDLRADDPYICRLRRGLNARDNNIDKPSQTECPA